MIKHPLFESAFAQIIDVEDEVQAKLASLSKRSSLQESAKNTVKVNIDV